ncbi:MAG: hypothetical protein Q8P12_03000, partial [bacterium]|nr:hypothetical protein [bacterium]
MTGKILQFGQALLSHKKALFGAAFLVLLLSLVPLQIAQANVFTDILEGIVTFPFRVIAALLVLVLFILALVGGLLFVLLG